MAGGVGILEAHVWLMIELESTVGKSASSRGGNDPTAYPGWL
ncbi:hypothetical protein CCACVL1_28983 [Corchorus capsularis]|uniref:Uncharacterized protein n=1 Tax=Corchorus capsularis TaxID=210143 RepID=A0A1R3G4E3_COCAP|nr:hypothetical protein CCACVL1_28983 [Corchorus capsularis]